MGDRSAASSAFRIAMGKRIRDQREALQMSQEELAARLSYKGKGSISRIESGETEVATSKILDMAAVLQTDVFYLMGWVDREPKPADPVETRLSEDEHELLGYYRKMNEQGKLSALLSVKGLSEQELFKKELTFTSNG